MSRIDSLYEQYEDALFHLLMEGVAEQEGKKALEENAKLQADPSAEVPKALYNKGLRIVRRGVASNQYRAASKTAIRLVSKVAIVVMVLILSLTVAFAVSSELQSSVARWAIKHYSDHTEFSITDRGESNAPNQGIIDEDGVWAGSRLDVEVGWMPDGMDLINEGNDSQSQWLILGGSSRKVLVLLDYIGEGKTDVDTENATISFITVQNKTALLVSKESYYYRIFIPISELDGYLLLTSEGLSEEEILKVAESIEIKAVA